VLSDVEADRDVLARITEDAGGTPGGLKEWGAWLTEKISRLKLKHGASNGLGKRDLGAHAANASF